MTIYKNVGSQKLAIFAYDSTDGSAKTGDSANITAQISLNGGTTAATNDTNPTELDATDAPGIYIFDLTQAETNADLIIVAPVSSTGDVLIDPIIIYTIPGTNTAIAANAIQISDDSTAANTLELFAEALDQSTGQLDSGSLATGTITASSIASDAITAAKVASDVGTEIAGSVWDHVDVGYIEDSYGQMVTVMRTNVNSILLDTGTDGVVLANNAITSAKIAANAITASSVATDVISEIWDSGNIDGYTHSGALSQVYYGAKNLSAGLVIISGPIGDIGNDTTHLHLDSITFGEDELNNHLIVVFDDSTGEYHSRWITDWVDSTNLATLDSALPFTPEDFTDTYIVMSIKISDSSGVTTLLSRIQEEIDLTPGGAVTVATVNANAIDADSFAADVDAEILSYIVNDATLIDASALNTATATSIPAIVTSTGTTLVEQIEDLQGTADSILIDTGTTIPAQITALNNLSAAQVNTEVDTALSDIHLDHLLATTYDPASKPGAADALFNELIENNGGVSRYTTNALENAPSGSGTSAEAIADAVWDELQSGHTGSGTFGIIASEIADILIDTSTTLQGELDGIQADTENIQSRLPAALVSGRIDANIGSISDDATAANTLELFVEALDQSTGQLDSGSLAADTITAASIASDAIAEINTTVDTALSDYDGPTNAEMVARTLVAASYATATSLQTIDDEIATIDGVVDSIVVDTQDIQSRLPAALISGKIDANTSAIANNSTAATNLAASASTIVRGTASGTPTTTTMQASDLSSTVDDFYNGRIIIWTSGALANQATDITDYTGATKTLTFTAVTSAASPFDTFVIV